MRFIDLHNHILPTVDDGAQTFEEALKLIEKSIEDGVTHLVLTPHVQSRAQKKDRSSQKEIFELLFNMVKEKALDIKLYLGAEIFYQSHLPYDFKDYTFGNDQHLLIEFSPHVETDIESVIYDLVHLGYKPIIAHIERYAYLDVEDYKVLKNLGAKFQMNALAAIQKDPYLKRSKLPQQLLKAGLIDFISSDAHHLEKKPPNLKHAYDILVKKYPSDYLNQLFYENALELLVARS